MKDLKIKYKNENGKVIDREYDTIMDFVCEMESDNTDIPMLDYDVICYIFFENPLNTGHATTIERLLERCKIMIQ